jgi:hypothetical protein
MYRKINHKPESFTAYAKTHGIELMKDDISMIRDILGLLPPSSKRTTLERYAAIWVENMKKEPYKIKQQNAGRRAANTFLREMVGK